MHMTHQHLRRIPAIYLAFLAAGFVLLAESASAQAPPQGGPGGGFGGFGGGFGGFGRGGGSSSFIRGMDRNGNGRIDPDEVPSFMRDRFESTLREAGLDPRQPVTIEKYEEIRRNRDAGRGAQSGGSSRGQGTSASPQTAAAPLVPGFGNEFEEHPVPGFGETEMAADAWEKEADPNTLRQAREILQRYDTNHDGVLERDEWKSVQWRNDPNQSDRDKDGKLTLHELTERLAGFSRDDGRGRDRSRQDSQAQRTLVTSNTSSSQGTPSGDSPFGRGRFGGGGFGGGGFGGDWLAQYYRGLDQDGNGKLDPKETAGNDRVLQRIRDAGFDPATAVSLDSFLEKLNSQPTPGFGGFGGGMNFGGGGMSFGGGPMGFGTPGGDSSGGGNRDGGSNERGGSRRGMFTRGGDQRGGDQRGGDRRGNGNNANSTAKNGAAGYSPTDPTTYRFRTAQELLPKDLPDWFAAKDSNGDGQVSMAEFTKVWSDSEVNRFQQYDANRDGVITPDELLGKSGTSSAPPVVTSTASRAAPRDDNYGDYASNGDYGSNDAGESSTGSQTSSANSTPAATTTTPESSTPASPATPANGTAGDDIAERAAKYLAEKDKNKSGALERDEWPSSKLLPPSDMDTDKDEVLTLAEITAYFRQRFGKH